jgi:hypothetical protein
MMICHSNRLSIYCLLTINIVLFSILFISPIYGQAQSNTEIQKQIEDSLIELYPSVEIEYNGNSTVVLKAEEKFLLQTEGNLGPLWNAIDKVSQFGYTLEEITTSGMGSEGNPTRFYAIMSIENTL